MAVELYAKDDHVVVVFSDLVRGEEGVQANQFLVKHGNRSALIDPGGALLYTPLSMAMAPYVTLPQLTYILASHQDPDIIGAVDRWLMYTPATVCCSRLWGRFVPHSVPHYQKNAGTDRFFLIPDRGADIPMGDTVIRAVPAHFLHSVGNFQFYDPISKILFSGDLGASIGAGPYEPVSDFDAHIPFMVGFHERYMVSNRVCRLWARMARTMDIEMIVPQHGRPIAGKPMVERFISWIEQLECGVDRLTQDDYVAA
jgi:flavorubredoxin